MNPRIIGNHIEVYVPYENRSKAVCISGARWDRSTKMWLFPVSRAPEVMLMFPETKDILKGFCPAAPIDLGIRFADSIKRKTATQIYDDFHIGAYQFKRKPYEHQITAMKGILAHRQFALFMDMGCGKTSSAIWAFDWLKGAGKAHRMLVICPKTLLCNWHEEINKNTNLTACIVDGRKAKRQDVLSINNDDVFIINYDGFMLLKNYDWSRFDFICLDESHYVKNPEAKRTQAILNAFTRRDVYKVIATGTPITQNPLDLYSQMQFLNSDYLGERSFNDFRNRYCIFGGYKHREIIGYRNVPRLRALVAKRSIQIKKDDCLDLPDKIYETRKLEMSKEVARQYTEMHRQLVAEIKNEGGIEKISARNVLVKILRLQQILSGEYVNEKDNEKMAALKDIVEGATACKEQLVIFARFRGSVSRISGMLTRIGINAVAIDGSSADRHEKIRAFQSGSAQVLVGSLATASEGITLTGARTAVFYENTFSLKDRIQAEARIHRIGQQQACVYIDLVYKRIVDEVVMQSIKNKSLLAVQIIKSFKKFTMHDYM